MCCLQSRVFLFSVGSNLYRLCNAATTTHLLNTGTGTIEFRNCYGYFLTKKYLYKFLKSIKKLLFVCLSFFYIPYVLSLIVKCTESLTCAACMIDRNPETDDCFRREISRCSLAWTDETLLSEGSPAPPVKLYTLSLPS